MTGKEIAELVEWLSSTGNIDDDGPVKLADLVENWKQAEAGVQEAISSSKQLHKEHPERFERVFETLSKSFHELRTCQDQMIQMLEGYLS